MSEDYPVVHRICVKEHLVDLRILLLELRHGLDRRLRTIQRCITTEDHT